MAITNMRNGIEINGVLYPYNDNIGFRAASQDEIDAENAAILAALAAGGEIG